MLSELVRTHARTYTVREPSDLSSKQKLIVRFSSDLLQPDQTLTVAFSILLVLLLCLVANKSWQANLNCEFTYFLAFGEIIETKSIYRFTEPDFVVRV